MRSQTCTDLVGRAHRQSLSDQAEEWFVHRCHVSAGMEVVPSGLVYSWQRTSTAIVHAIEEPVRMAWEYKR